MSLLASLGIRDGDVVAVAGAGGKTTLVYRLASEARQAGFRVLVTTTTHMGSLPEEVTGPVFLEEDGDPAPGLAEALQREGRATLIGRRVRADKLEGVSPDHVRAHAGGADVVLVEADGARGRSLKVPAPHEPVVPRATTLLVVMAALDVLGEPLTEERIHRLDLVCSTTGTAVGEAVDEDTVVSCLRHALGYPSRVPPGARAAVFLNKAEGEDTWQAAVRIGRRLVPPYCFVVAGSARGDGWRVWP